MDDTAPTLDKTVGDPNCVITEDEEYCVTTSTEITVTAENAGCCVDTGLTLEYRIWYAGSWSAWADVTGPITFAEECLHYLEIRARDCLGNEVLDNETFWVDDTYPVINKTVGDPSWNVEGDDWYVNLSTPITINATDDGCCPDLTVEYRIWYNGTWTEWIDITDILPYIFTFTENCTHYLEIRAFDCLGHTILDNETFYVNHLEPPRIEIIKKIWNGTAWVDHIITEIGATLRFNLSMHNDGIEDLVDINITDHLPPGFQYANNATVNGIPHEPNETWNNNMSLAWHIPGPLPYCNWIYIEFNVTIVERGDRWYGINNVVVVAAGQYTGIEVTDDDNVTVNIDTEPPWTNKTYQGCTHINESGEWISTDTIIILNATDNDSGVSEIWYRVLIWDYTIDNWTVELDWTLYWDINGNGTGPFTIPTECYHMIQFYSIDLSGNSEEIQYQTPYVDGSLPIIHKEHPTVGYWYYEDTGEQYILPYAIITLSATDLPKNECSAGIEGIFWRYEYNNVSYPQNESDNEYGTVINISIFYNDTIIHSDFAGVYLWWIYNDTSAIFFKEECKHILYYFAKDRVCHHTPVHNQTYYVDDTPPHSWLTLELDYWDIHITSTTEFTIWAEDEGCNGGVGSYTIHFAITGPQGSMFYWNGNYYPCDGSWHTGPLTTPVAFQIRDQSGYAPPGKYTIRFYAVDDLGNTETPQNIRHFILDNTPPTTTLSFIGPTYTKGVTWISGTTLIKLEANDKGADVKLIKYRIDNGIEKTYTDPFSLPSEGQHTIYYYSKDWTNNIENLNSYQLSVDNTPPETQSQITG